MREIKFRAWDIESPAMLTWEEIQEDWETEGYSDNILRGDHYVPMQYTGLKDRKGEEIYEGDILKYTDTPYSKQLINTKKDEIGLVEYDEIDAMFTLTVNDICWNFSNENSEWWTVIGNIYENPELLNEVRE